MYSDASDIPYCAKVIPVRDESEVLGFIVIHRGNKKHPAFGATRIAPYTSISMALHDALNLAHLMSLKASFAGLSYGGGKGVLLWRPEFAEEEQRKRIFRRYAEVVNSLSGMFVTGSDVGMGRSEVLFLKTLSPHIVGVTEDPTEWTANGVLRAIQVTLQELYGDSSLAGRSVAIQGVGKIGSALLERLYGKAGDIVIAEVDSYRLQLITERLPNVRVTTTEKIIEENVDIFAPCALGGVITTAVAERLRARAVVGSANNQLASNAAGEILARRGILYAPDYIANAGGLISVVREFEGQATSELLSNEIEKIGDRLRDVYARYRETHIPTNVIADKLAMRRLNTLFPVPVIFS